jgi:hypothetical protein
MQSNMQARQRCVRWMQENKGRDRKVVPTIYKPKKRRTKQDKERT